MFDSRHVQTLLIYKNKFIKNLKHMSLVSATPAKRARTDSAPNPKSSFRCTGETVSDKGDLGPVITRLDVLQASIDRLLDMCLQAEQEESSVEEAVTQVDKE